jgi:hypothetical protein
MRTSGRLIVTENKVQSFRVAQHLDAGAKKIHIVSGRRIFRGLGRLCRTSRESEFLGEVIGIRDHPGERISDPICGTVRRCRD